MPAPLARLAHARTSDAARARAPTAAMRTHPPLPAPASSAAAALLELDADDDDSLRRALPRRGGLHQSATCESLSSTESDVRQRRRRVVDRSAEGKMRAVHVMRYGAPKDSLKCGWVDRPTAADLVHGQALIRVNAAGISPTDYRLRDGSMRRLVPLRFPCMLGYDFSGVVEAIIYPESGQASSGWERLAPGDEVYGRADNELQFGSYAEWIVVSVSRIARKPKNCSFVQAAALPTISLTSHAALKQYARLKVGERILIFGASAGVGHVAVQIAKALGASVIAATCSESSSPFVRELGATMPLDYHNMSPEEIVRRAEPDVVFDTVGASEHWDAVQKLCPHARFVVASGSECLGALAGARGVGYVDVLDYAARFAGRKALSRIRKGPGYHIVLPSALDTPLSIITPLVERGVLTASIAKEFALTDVVKAHELGELKRVRGKLVLVVRQ